VAVTKVGELPPGDESTALEFKGTWNVSGEPNGNFKVRLVRGGCMVTSFTNKY
jgi:hypothetical protein